MAPVNQIPQETATSLWEVICLSERFRSVPISGLFETVIFYINSNNDLNLQIEENYIF